MKVKQIWMSRDTRGKSRYGVRTLGGIYGIALLMMGLILGGTLLSFWLNWPRELFAVLLCLGVTALGVTLAVRLGQRAVQDTTAFFLTEDDRLFVMDFGRLTGAGDNGIACAAGILRMQRQLRRFARSPELPSGADEILRVEKIREHRACQVIVCQVHSLDGAPFRRTYFLVEGIEDEEALLCQLERRMTGRGCPEDWDSRRPLAIVTCILLCCAFAGLCVLSHPAYAQLPQVLYFPCLAAAFAALCGAVWLGVRQYRGE